MASGKSKRKKSGPPVIENRRARHDYAIQETLEVGMALTGSEVKSLRDGKASLAEGYVRAQEKPPALYLHAVNIAEYPPAYAYQHNPTRVRKLLAKKKEIDKLVRQVSQKGVTVVPLKIYFERGFAKLLIGVGTGRSKQDRRDAITEREAKRDIDRAMSRRMSH